ncbi:hypothetical protein [Flavilitoribacter nigricans]|uniref:hypothetical protein n=1 Tax=Flavilitoribacter nigricans TaxID=70997 RepID=UPI00117B713F|nr:hypothetical protein [Flavilitoribacter nigricans]
MLICNNCNSVNDDHVQKCKHCQMSGNFRRQMGENRSDNTPVLQIVKVLCRNCGSDSPGEDTKCVHCRFPLVRPAKVEVWSEKSAEVSSTIPSIEKQQ